MLSVSFPLISERTFSEKGFLPEGTFIRDNVAAIEIPNVALGFPANSAFFPLRHLLFLCGEIVLFADVFL